MNSIGSSTSCSPPHQRRRDAVALQQRRQVHVRAERGALQEVDLESHGRAAHHRPPRAVAKGFADHTAPLARTERARYIPASCTPGSRGSRSS